MLESEKEFIDRQPKAKEGILWSALRLLLVPIAPLAGWLYRRFS